MKKNGNKQYIHDKCFILYNHIISIFSYSKPRIKRCDFVRYYVFKYLNFINGGSCQNPLMFENDTIYKHVLHLSQRSIIHLILPREKKTRKLF